MHFYILSESFCKYLVDTHGIEGFMRLYEAQDLEAACRQLHAGGRAGLLADWRAMLEGLRDIPDARTVADQFQRMQSQAWD